MRFQWVSLVLLGMTVAAFAQEETPRMELFTGYSFARVHLVDAGIFTSEHANLNGWNTGFDWNANRWWGITGDFSGYYGGPSFEVIFKPPNCVLCTQGATRTLSSEHAFLVGPKITVRSGKIVVFAHALWGGAHLSEKQQGQLIGTPGFPPPPTSATSSAMALGGGVDVVITPHVALRVQPDYLLTRFANTHQNNFRISTGPVFRFGS
jgi:hypothetical protein